MNSDSPGAKSRTQTIGSIEYLRHELEYHTIGDYGGEILSSCKEIIDQHTGENDLGLKALPTETYASFSTVKTTRNGRITYEKNDPVTPEIESKENMSTCSNLLPKARVTGNIKRTNKIESSLSKDRTKNETMNNQISFKMNSLCMNQSNLNDLDNNDIRDALVHLTIRHSGGQEQLTLTVQHIKAREKEMKRAALNLNINWSESYIMSELRERQSQDEGSSSILIEYNLRRELARVACNRCDVDTFQWNKHFVDVIRGFYESGRVALNEHCTYHGTILLLKSLGILYSKDEIKFDSFTSFLRSRNWEVYEQNRERLALFIETEMKLVEIRKGKQGSFITIPYDTDDDEYFLGDMHCKRMRMDREHDFDHDTYALVHSFFHEDHIERDASSREYTRQMRLNFAAFLYRRMSHPASVSFAPRQVMIYSGTDSSTQNVSVMPVLLIERISSVRRQQVRHDNSFLINELLSGESLFPFSVLQKCTGCSNNFDDAESYASTASGSEDEELSDTMAMTMTSSRSSDQLSNTFGNYDAITSSFSDSDIYMQTPTYVKIDDINAKWLASIFVGTR